MNQGTELHPNTLRRRAEVLVDRLKRPIDAASIHDGVNLVDELRRVRDFSAMQSVAESLSRHDPGNARLRRLYAQSLIETGHATAAIDVAQQLSKKLRLGDPEWAEARGLVGRAYKQIFADLDDPYCGEAREALNEAIAAYSQPYKRAPRKSSWHGVNLIALLDRRHRLGFSGSDDLDGEMVARAILRRMQRPDGGGQDHWRHATLAEANLALRDWDAVEKHLQSYVADPRVSAFELGSTLRQFTQIWDLEADSSRGSNLVAILRARLMELPGGEMDLTAETIQRLGEQARPPNAQIEAILGEHGPVTWRWWQTGLERARSVCAIRERLGDRIGTGFLVRAGDIGQKPADELMVLTNYHVVNNQTGSVGLLPDAVEIEFEVASPHQPIQVEVVWQSPVEQCDACLLRLLSRPPHIDPLPISPHPPLPIPASAGEAPPRVYVIGHPGGRDLAFSFQDNELLDHEAPPEGTPANPGVRRLHYRAPTRQGSSGSPVFNSQLWEVIALHHKGGRTMQRLNGKSGSYDANQGIWIQSIRDAISAS